MKLCQLVGDAQLTAQRYKHWNAGILLGRGLPYSVASGYCMAAARHRSTDDIDSDLHRTQQFVAYGLESMATNYLVYTNIDFQRVWF